jgi:hypothetical protein
LFFFISNDIDGSFAAGKTHGGSHDHFFLLGGTSS